MGYEHKPVHALPFIDRATKFKSDLDETKRLAEEAGWQYWYREYPVHPKLAPLLTALEATNPALKLIPVKFERSIVTAGFWTRFCAVMDGQPFTLGAIGYGDYGRKGKPTYGIYSRKVKNERHGSYQMGYNMAMPEKLESALKQAKKYLTPYTNLELIDVLYHCIKDPIYQRKEIMRSRMNELVNSSGFGWSRPNPNELIVELKNIKDSGLKCVTPAFLKAMDGIEEAHMLMLKLEAYNPVARFVRIEAGSDPLVHVSDPNANRSILSYRLDTLPQEIMEKVAVLQILDNFTYVDEIGYKYNNNIFFLEQEA